MAIHRGLALLMPPSLWCIKNYITTNLNLMKTTINFLSTAIVLNVLKSRNLKIVGFLSFMALLSFSCDSDNDIGLLGPDVSKADFSVEVQNLNDDVLLTAHNLSVVTNKKVWAKANIGDSRDDCAGSGFCNVIFDRPYLNDDRTVDIEIHLSGIDNSGRFQISKIVFPDLPQKIKDDYFANKQFEVASTFEKTVTINGTTGIIIIEKALYKIFGSIDGYFMVP